MCDLLFTSFPQRQFTGTQIGLTSEVLRILPNYSWPGNVRELENTIEHAIAVCSDQLITPDDLPARILANASASNPSLANSSPVSIFDDRPTLNELSRRYIGLILAENNGNKSRAAEILGINRRTLYRYLDSPNVNPLELDESEIS